MFRSINCHAVTLSRLLSNSYGRVKVAVAGGKFDIDQYMINKRSMFKDQHFMDVEVAEEFAQPYKDKDLEPKGKYYMPTIDLERNWGTDVILFIRDINDSIKEDTLVFLTDRQKYVYDKIQALPKGIDSIGLMIANNTVIDDEKMEQNLVANYIYKPLTEEQSELINQMRLISTPRQLRYFLIEHPQLQDINTQALNAAIILKGYKISRRHNKIIVYSQGRKQRKESQEQSSEQSSLESSEIQMQHMIEQIFANGNQCHKDQVGRDTIFYKLSRCHAVTLTLKLLWKVKYDIIFYPLPPQGLCSEILPPLRYVTA
ncbi:MAG: hypothetical protein EZS28_038023 [Streblomastix strix]|uniref:Uncharacterized protein n=1 Tax=Streblomastix strix TaxID=222440 RepID=A0A5J4U990_9EUKA|nr:MAG: hypothetical protein EZS28_038023 [Streblomastix strix]